MGDAFVDYLAELRRKLAKKCERSEVDEVIEEAHGHLRESYLEHISHGVFPDDAEWLALAEFGDVHTVAEWYASVHGRPPLWKVCWWPIAFLLLNWVGQNVNPTAILNNLIYVNDLPPRYEGLSIMMVSEFLLFYACFRSRRFTSCVRVPILILVFQIICRHDLANAIVIRYESKGKTYEIAATKAAYQDSVREARSRIQELSREVPFLTRGFRAYQPTREAPSGVGSFHSYKGYLSETNFEPGRYVDEFTFRAIRFDSYNEARKSWEAAPQKLCKSTDTMMISYLAEHYDQLADTRNELANYETALKTPLNVRRAVISKRRFPELEVLAMLAIAGDLIGALWRWGLALGKRYRRQGPLAT